MTDSVNKLTSKLKMQNGKKPTAEHHLEGRNFPFYTRNPERVKFQDSFDEIVGIITRYSLGKEALIESIQSQHIEKIVKSLELEDGVTREDVENLFGIDFETIKTPILLQYLPVEMEQKVKKDESRGKKLLGTYIVELLQLRNNKQWSDYISKKHATDIYEKVYIDALPDLDDDKSKKENFHFFDQEELVSQFNCDLNQLMKNEQFFLKYIGLLISYYFFYYVLEQSYLLLEKERTKKPLWFTYDKEKVSSGRDAAKNGYKLFNLSSKDLLVKNDVLDYLNILTEKENYKTYSEIVSDTENEPILIRNLVQFNYEYAQSIGTVDSYIPDENLDVQINQLLKFLQENISKETASRYRKSFDEFVGLGFVKRRGRLGYILNATQEFVLLFVGIIVGDREKILLKELFLEFEKRGIYFDKQSRRELTSFFEEVNIIEKLSDSGDAQYVKSIL